MNKNNKPWFRSFMVREKNEDGAVEDLMEHLWENIGYWDKTKGNSRDKLEGLAFSFLTMIDGCDGTGYNIKPLVTQLEDAFEFGDTSIYSDDIGYINRGIELHDEFYPYGREKGFVKDDE